MDFKYQVFSYLNEFAMKDFDKPEEENPVKIAKIYVDNAYVRIQKYLMNDPKFISKSAEEKGLEIYKRIVKGLTKTITGLYNIKINGIYMADRIAKMPQTTKKAFFSDVKRIILDNIKGNTRHLGTKSQIKTFEMNQKINKGVKKAMRGLDNE